MEKIVLEELVVTQVAQVQLTSQLTVSQSISALSPLTDSRLRFKSVDSDRYGCICHGAPSLMRGRRQLSVVSTIDTDLLYEL